MDKWLKKALSEQQKEEDQELAKKRNVAEKISALKVTAVTYINQSGIYDIIARYFADIDDRVAVSRVKEAKVTRWTPFQITNHFGFQEGLSFIDSISEFEHDPESGRIEHVTFSGNQFHSVIKTANKAEVCHVTIAVLLQRNQEFAFTPVVGIAFGQGWGYEDENIFTNINPTKETLSSWLKEKTTHYLKKISPKK